MRKTRKGRRLVSRVYLYGVFLLVTVWIAVVGVGAAFGGMKPRREMPRRMLQHVAADLAPLVDRPDDLSRALSRTSDELLTQLSIHDARGALVAAADEAEARPFDPSRFPAEGEEVAEFDEPRGLVVPMPTSRPLYLVGLRPAFDVPIERPLAIFGAVLVVLAIVSIPFARSIARPLERLTDTAEELGHGKLSVRSGLRRNDEVGRLATAFDEMAARLEALVRSEKELLANVSHELRTPLARIRVAVELAEEGDLDQARLYLREIGADLLELDRLIEDVLTAARLDAGHHGGSLPVHLQEMDPSSVVEQSAARFRKEHADRELVVSVAPGMPAVQADRVLLRRVLDNLVDNARKYSDGAIVLGARADGDGVAMWVEDRGIGVDPADLERLFEPFFRTDRSRARRSGGLGLGLTLARRIVEAHGGTLVAQSEPGRGSTFTVRLPAAAEPAPARGTAVPL